MNKEQIIERENTILKEYAETKSEKRRQEIRDELKWLDKYQKKNC